MPLRNLPEKEAVSFECYRNIATIKTTQNLFDDLTNKHDNLPIIQAWADKSSGIDHMQENKNRSFQYADPQNLMEPFEKKNFYLTRFSDGSFGVWYGALERDTSIEETLYWQYRNIYKPMLNKAKGPITVDRSMYKAKCESDSIIDLRKIDPQPTELTSNAYAFCQKLGAYAKQNSISLYFTPSARLSGGTCVPIFNPNAIASSSYTNFLHFTFYQDGKIVVTTDIDEMRFIPPDW